MPYPLLEQVAHNWGWVTLRGVVAVLFGLMAFAWPGLTLATLVLVWGAFALADGVLSLVAAFRGGESGRPFWSLAIVGLLGIAAGVLAWAWPGVTALVLLMFIAAWAIVMGAFQIAAAIRLRKEIEGEWLLVFGGVASVVFGALLMARPGAGALALAWLIAAYAVVFGVALVLLAFRVRSFGARPASA